MSEDNEEFDPEHEIFALDMSDVEANKRAAVRYIRQDITAILTTKSLFRVNEFLVRLIDISSKGATIACSEKLKVNNKVTLNLTFQDGKKFVLPAKVIHTENMANKHYGLKFDRCKDQLGEHLLSSQNDLIFK